MQSSVGSTHPRLALSPSALSAFFECRHHTGLELEVAAGLRTRPGENEIERVMLERRGMEHEARILEAYRGRGLRIVELPAVPAAGAEGRALAFDATLEAMRQGADVIYQGVLIDGEWSARPDFLLKVALETSFGDHGYEVVDAKLARRERARAILQLCAYTELLARCQAAVPHRFWLALGDQGEPHAFRAADYLAYYRLARARFEAFVSDRGARAETYPEPVEYCDVCRYWKQCEEQRRSDDHTSLVASITRRQRDRLATAGVRTLTELAQLEPVRGVEGIDAAPLSRIRHQARLQLAARDSTAPGYELLTDVDPGSGLERLPEPTPGDLFLDLEGDAFVAGGGIEYLFGWVELGQPEIGWSRRETAGEPRYHACWAADAAGEKAAFEAFVRRVRQGQNEFPRLHVFHFGHREVDALKRLSCRYGSMEDEVDALLREHVFVDLHSVLRQSVRAGVEGYTLKQLEPLHGFQRQIDRRAAARAMQLYGYWLETGDGAEEIEQHRRVIEGYNREDVLSTWRLRDWLEARRPELQSVLGRDLARPSAEPEAAAAPREGKAEAAALAEELRRGLPLDEALDDAEQAARRLLAHLVNWHWRELKSAYWEYYRARELAPSERREDRLALDGLEYEGEAGAVKQSLVHRYRFPPQEHAIRRTPGAEDPDAEGGKGKNVTVLEVGSSHVLLKRSKKSRDAHPRALIPARPLSYGTQEKSLWALARSVNAHGLGAQVAELGSARSLLLREPPACGQEPGAPLLGSGEDTALGIVRLALALERGVLAVQGPPGSGKTHRAANAIVALIAAGKRVGVSANSHQVIISLLTKSCDVARERGVTLAAHHLYDEDEWDSQAPLPFPLGKNYPKVLEALRSGQLSLVGGTTFAWSREDFRQAVDVLVIDEAAQVSLANVLAAAAAAPRLMLFGDPAQLEQPQRGVHPPSAAVSALEHWMGPERLTMPDHLGVFLPETRRLHPEVCRFTSTVFYEGRLAALPGLDAQCIEGAGRLSGSGLRWLPVHHDGNTNQSPEEVAAVAGVIGELLADEPAGAVRPQFRDRAGARPLTGRDILVVAPYNAQVAALRRALPADVRVGTVDKFQGQEAPIVIYSLTTSSGRDAPRGLEFLYSLNRLNVATSRALALVLLVSSPELASAACRTPRQLQLVNALCTYLELAPRLD